jgi:hypothetical protein
MGINANSREVQGVARRPPGLGGGREFLCFFTLFTLFTLFALDGRGLEW